MLLQLHEGVKKSGIMGFFDPCPGEPKLLLVEYTHGGEEYKVLHFPFHFSFPTLHLDGSLNLVPPSFKQVAVDDYEELLIPQRPHKV